MRITILIYLLIQGFAFSQTGWYQLYNAPVTTISDVKFVNSNTGYACAYTYNPTSRGKLLKTTNGGVNWTVTDIDSAGGSSLFTPQELWFVNANTGFIIGGHICRTTDGGITFSRIRYNSGTLTNIQFINEQTGWVTGYIDSSLSAILRTSNGGLNWQIIPITSNGAVTNIFFMNANTGWLSKLKPPPETNSVYKSTNGGLNWTIPSPSPESGGILFFYSENSGDKFGRIGLGGGNTVTLHDRTTNSGVSWYSSSGYDDTYVEDFYVLNSSTAWICGGNAVPSTSSGKILKTTNSGINWNVQSYDNSPQKFTAISFVNGSTGWAISGTRIYKTTTGGDPTGIEPISSEVPERFSLSQNYPNPFNPTTNFEFRIADFGLVNLTIYDAMGRVIETLQNGELKPGVYKAEWNASGYPSGVYFYKLSAGSFTETNKMILAK